jgi:UDP-N-acetylmuramate: L-alanyl-gamma-D-glutamyl-meso-diaminopimelate ligase
MAAHLWQTAGRQPGFLIGGASLDFPKPWQRGGGEWFIIEGDEYDSAFFNKVPKFLHYRPHTVILTSIEFDHADIYPNLQAVIEAFTELVKIIPPEGRLIANGDDALVRQVAAKARCAVEFYGLGEGNDWRVLGFEAEDWNSSFELIGPEGFYARLSLSRPGVYNALNAAAASAAFIGAGGDGRWPSEAWRSFKGAKRRQEVLGTFGGVELVDDFAHHPTAVAETLKAARRARPERRILAAFEPRSNTSRRAVFQKDYAEALAGADLVFLRRPTDPHKAPEGDRLDIDRLAVDLAPKARLFDDGPALGRALAEAAQPGDVAVVMSNGGFDGLTSLLPALLAQNGEHK